MLSVVRLGNKYFPKNYGFLQQIGSGRFVFTKSDFDNDIVEEKTSGKQHLPNELKFSMKCEVMF